MHTPRALLHWVFCLAGLTASGALVAQSPTAERGTLIGVVANSATHNLLQGVRVEIPALGRAVLTDNTGRFVFNDVPAGSHEIVASYLGLDTQRVQVNVVGGRRNDLNIDLSAEVYQLAQFTVTGEVEGNALALTAQRNAENVKNVVALDAYGNLPNMSAGELAVRLPGVASQLDDEGNVTGLIVRGSSSQLSTASMSTARSSRMSADSTASSKPTASPARCSSSWRSSRPRRPTSPPIRSAARSI